MPAAAIEEFVLRALPEPEGDSPLAAPARLAAGDKPNPLDTLWRGSEWARAPASNWPSGHAALDGELPGGGWPGHGLTELLQPLEGVLECRLLAPALQRITAAGKPVVLVGTPMQGRLALAPHLAGWRQAGLDERQLVWIQAETSAERLWCAEQLLKANACGALLAWLPQARPEQMRRLQVAALGHEGPAFLCRHERAAEQASAAPLRLLVRPGEDWSLAVRVLKRRGPQHEGWLSLPAVPAAMAGLLTPRLRQPHLLWPQRPGSVPAGVAAAGVLAEPGVLSAASLLCDEEPADAHVHALGRAAVAAAAGVRGG